VSAGRRRALAGGSRSPRRRARRADGVGSGCRAPAAGRPAPGGRPSSSGSSRRASRSAPA